MDADDPFRHHPGLRDKITDPAQSFFRDFSTEKLCALAEEHGLPVGWWYSEEDREAHRAASLAGRMDGDLWVFGYGSLMWDPALVFSEVRRARVTGWQRRFILKEVHGGRGDAECPGLMAALDAGGACDGLVFRLDRAHLDRETDILWRREVIGPAYRVEFVAAETPAGPVEALAFVADHDADQIDAEIPYEDQVRLIARAEGILGTSRAYLEGIASKLRDLGIHDEDVERLLADVETFCADPG